MKTTYTLTAIIALFFSLHFTSHAQGTAFTYQGRLNFGGSPANGSYNFQFTLYQTNVTGSAIAGPVTNFAVNVSNGLFVTGVDFGNIFTGASNWLEIAVSTNTTNSYTTLAPRQQLTPVPYSMFAENAGTVAATNLAGTIPLAKLPTVLITNNESSATLSNATMNGTLILGNPVMYWNNSSNPFFIVDNENDIFLGPLAGNLTTASQGGSDNIGIGPGALEVNTNGALNVAIGYAALYRNTSGNLNVAIGNDALGSNQSGNQNVANGGFALYGNTNGSFNLAEGFEAMNSGNGSNNVALGYWALKNGTDSGAVAVGYQALMNDVAEEYWGLQGRNTAVGYQSLYADTNGLENTAVGYEALSASTGGSYNTAVGSSALENVRNPVTGIYNVAVGDDTLATDIDGGENTAVGSSALISNDGSGNVAIGYNDLWQLTGGSGNIAIGTQSGYYYTGNESDNILIGNGGNAGENNTIRIGTQGTQTTTVIAGIYGGTLPGGATTAPVVVDNNGHLASAASGTFTPLLSDGSGNNFNTSTADGYYSKVGNLVYFEIWIKWTGKGSASSGNPVAVSLPFATTSAQTRFAFTLAYVNGISFGSQLIAGANNSSSTLFLTSLSNSSSVAPSSVFVSNFASTGEIQISGWYRWQ